MTTTANAGDTPKVSVLVPVYNTPVQYLREAVDSILGQTFADFELIIVNDASTDEKVEETVRGYADPRIRYFVNPVNLGISGTRNRLLDLARGDYLAIMDHDDVSFPERLRKEVEYLDANPDVGVVSCVAEVTNDKATELRFPVDDADIRLALFENNVIVHSACMFRKSALEAHGIRYEAEYTPAEDYAICCRLVPHTRLHNLPDTLLRYRNHESNTSRLQREQSERMRLAVRNRYIADNPALYNTYCARARHVTQIKLFGFIPFLKIMKRGRRTICTLFGIPLYRSKRHSDLR